MFQSIRPAIRAKIQPVLWKLYSFYSRKDRWHSYRGIKVLVKPSVFHPGFLISTHVFVNFLATQFLHDKKVLEIGTGSGLIALFCKQQGAQVVATDINPAAVASVKESSVKNDLPIKIIHSDLFKEIPTEVFDILISNPPYFPETPKNDKEKAFYCGPAFEFFENLFAQAPDYLAPNGILFMILSDDCDLTRIESIADKHNWSMDEVHRIKKMGEWNMIYAIKK